MTVLWTAAEAAQATGGKTGDWSATGVSIDTRTLEPGDLFVALKDARDGHEFVAAALAKGAAAALVTHRPEGVSEDAPLLIVPDVLEALGDLGRHARARTNARVAAITGSVGKTSTKEMLRAALAGQGNIHASVASYNNHWGVPLTLARMPADTDYAVIEIGMNHPGEIAPLARMARPHVAMVTTVAAAHLEAFENVAGIAREKGSICEGLEPNGTAVLNADIAEYPILAEAATQASRVRFGSSTDHEYQLQSTNVTEGATVAKVSLGGEAAVMKVSCEGRHFALNALGVLAVCDALGADRAQALCGLAAWAPPAGRGARETITLDPVETQLKLTLLDDAYNANPTSMVAALDVLASTRVSDDIGRVGKGRRIAFLGDMKELGPDGPGMHADLADEPAMERIDLVHCIGPLMQSLYAALPIEKRGLHVDTAAELAPQVRGLVDAGDAVLAKGSLSMGLAQIVDAVRKLGHPDAGEV